MAPPRMKLVRDSIRLRLPLRHPGLTQAFDDTRMFRIKGRIIGPVDVRPSLHSEARMELLELARRLLGLLLVPSPGVGGREIDIGPPGLGVARDCLAAPFDRLFPVCQ